MITLTEEDIKELQVSVFQLTMNDLFEEPSAFEDVDKY